MAAEAAEKDAKKGAEPEKKSKKKLIIIAVAALVVLGAGAKFTVLAPKKAVAATSATDAAAAKKKAEIAKLGPVEAAADQTINLADGHYLTVGVVLQLKATAVVVKAASADAATPQTSLTAQAIINTFSNVPMSQLTGVAAQKAAKSRLVKALDDVYPDELADVYFTKFLMQ